VPYAPYQEFLAYKTRLRESSSKRAFQQTGGAGVFGFSYAANDVHVSIAGQSVAATRLLVSGNFFSTLGVPTIIGRPLDDGDDNTKSYAHT
jgi:hypothetical protein